MHVADRLAHLPPYVFASVEKLIAAERAKGVDVINLGIGSPDLAPPQFIIDALCESASRSDTHGYAGYFGIPALLQALADYYGRRFGVELDPQREIQPLIGSKEGLANSNLAFVDPGDLVLVPDPGYPTYAMGALLAGGSSYPMPLTEEHDFLVDFDAIPAEVAHRAKLLWLNYPNNPTGAVAPLDFLRRAVDFARAHDILICFDNPYCDLTFDGYVAPSILQVPGAKDVALEFNSLSKTYNMAGWRIGMAVGNAQAVEALTTVKTHIDSGIFRPIQAAAVAALNGDQSWLQERNRIYQRRRDIIMSWLPQLGMSARPPKGALYIWAKAPEGEDCADFCMRILQTKG
ncbi:MAG: aminotransferase class I/II-fold pyridoxal phosphate-dependent enzyme, partial [Anaerolineae bacterium]|nr:aminotransferase class I/II-fold pyridoxal phosphate-dependent enzyme [Anaerolineae bacterium]